MNTAALRTLIIYAVILPLAVFIGWLVSGDMTKTSFAVLTAIVFVLLLPLLLKFHYPVLIFSWNTFITIFFLPGQPALWMFMAAVNFGIAILTRIIQKRPAFISAPSITFSLLTIAAIVAITAKIRGGIGLQSMGGSTIGGKGYFFIIAAIIGYFAFASQSIPPQRARFYVGLFFLSGLVSACSNLIYYAGPGFYFLFLVFPVGFAAVQASSEYGGGLVSRVAGFTIASSSVIYYLLATNAIRGVLTKWWRVLLVIVLLGLGAMGGYRSTLALVGLVFVILFVFEGLLRTPIFPVMLLIGALSFALLVPFASYLPTSIQRSLSFLPALQINPFIKHDARSSLEWRKQIRDAMIPELPKYIWIGKGYVLNPTDLYLTQQAVRRGQSPDTEGAILAGDYHNGPLSVFVPFGSFGSVAFLAFMAVALRALHLNARYGRQELRTINRLLYAYFLGRLIFFLFAFGAFASDLFLFTGTLGLSVALNNGICQKPVTVPSPVRFSRPIGLDSAQPGAA